MLRKSRHTTHVIQRTHRCDVDGQSIENFGMADNLMMTRALNAAGVEMQPSFRVAILCTAEYLQHSMVDRFDETDDHLVTFPRSGSTRASARAERQGPRVIRTTPGLFQDRARAVPHTQ